MREIIMKPDLYKFETFKEFTEEFGLGKGDLILTTRPVYDSVINQTLDGTDAAQALCVIQEDYGKGVYFLAGSAEQPVVLGEDEYFVLGDNRINSIDSRYAVGKVRRSQITGRAVFRVWPLSGFGSVIDY